MLFLQKDLDKFKYQKLSLCVEQKKPLYFYLFNLKIILLAPEGITNHVGSDLRSRQIIG